MIIRSNTIDHIWAPAAEGALECQGNTDCSGGERCGPPPLPEVVDLPELRSGVRVRVLGKVETRRGRLMIVDARLDDPLLIERLGAGGRTSLRSGSLRRWSSRRELPDGRRSL